MGATLVRDLPIRSANGAFAPTGNRLKIALVNQPTEAYTPPNVDTSIALWNYEMGHALSQFSDVVVYAKTRRGWANIDRDGPIECRRFSTLPDVPLRKLLRWTAGMRNRRRSGIASAFYHLAYAYEVARDLRHQGCDVVHIANYSQFIPIIRRFNPHIRIVLHMHCNWLTQIDADIVRPRLEQADLILGCSQHIARRIAERFPEVANRCDTIHNGASRSFFTECTPPTKATSGPGRKILFVGRVSPEKGVHVLIKAFRSVAARHPDVTLDIVGPTKSMPQAFYCDLSDDEERAVLLPLYQRDYFAWVSQLVPVDLQKRVRFVGGIEHVDIHNAYQNADICVIPSVCEEAFSLPVAEAMAAGLPVIGSRVGGIPEIIEDGRTGLLVPKSNPDALAAAISRLLEDTDLRLSMGRAGRARCAEFFTWEHSAQALLRRYNVLCLGHAHAA